MDGRTINETSFISVFFLMELVLNKKKIIFTEIDFGSVISKTGLNLFYIVTSLFYGLVLNKKKKKSKFTEIDFGLVISKTGLHLFYIVTSWFYGLVSLKLISLDIFIQNTAQ